MIFYLLLLILLINFSNCTNNLIYSITSNNLPSEGQIINIINPINNDILFNKTIVLGCVINGIASIDESEMTATVLCDYRDLIMINLNNGEFKVIGSVYSLLPTFASKMQQFIYSDNMIYLPVSTKNIDNLSLFSYNFNSNTFFVNLLSTKDYNYTVDGTSIGGFDYNINKMYILYSSDRNNSNSNLISFSVDDISNTLTTYESIENLNTWLVQLLFTNNQGDLYALYGNPETLSFEVCLFKLQSPLQNNSCSYVFSIPISQVNVSFSYLHAFLNEEKQQFTIVLLGENNSIQFNTYFISNFTIVNQYNINNIWGNSNIEQTTYFYS
ncbi:hypothetical protein RB653_002828 [Dictyostelium firmibasis]|uniref:Transmembrane protein n=1 Tax=Dictyostelium firmibasis TaxID=79012 RepID=A0AAN7YZ06_9MYCE